MPLTTTKVITRCKYGSSNKEKKATVCIIFHISFEFLRRLDYLQFASVIFQATTMQTESATESIIKLSCAIESCVSLHGDLVGSIYSLHWLLSEWHSSSNVPTRYECSKKNTEITFFPLFTFPFLLFFCTNWKK